MTQKSIKVGIRGEGGRAWAEAQALLDYDAARPPEGAQSKPEALLPQVCLCWTVPIPVGKPVFVILFTKRVSMTQGRF